MPKYQDSATNLEESGSKLGELVLRYVFLVFWHRDLELVRVVIDLRHDPLSLVLQVLQADNNRLLF